MDNSDRCHCGGQYQRQDVQVRMSRAGNPLVLDEVVRYNCQTCGSWAFPRGVLQVIENGYWDVACALRAEG